MMLYVDDERYWYKCETCGVAQPVEEAIRVIVLVKRVDGDQYYARFTCSNCNIAAQVCLSHQARENLERHLIR